MSMQFEESSEATSTPRLFIALGELVTIDIRVESDVKETHRFAHPVIARDSAEASDKVRDHYKVKEEASFSGGPYGTRYNVTECQAWEQIGGGLADLLELTR